MKKAILAVLVILVLAVAGGVYYITSNLDHLVKAAIEKYGSQATHTAVKVSHHRSFMKLTPSARAA